MSGVFAFLGGALNARQNDIDEDKKRMADREKYMRDALLRMAPEVAAQKSKAVAHNARYKEAFAILNDDYYAKQYATDDKLNSQWLMDMRRPAGSGLGGQTAAATGQANFQKSQETPMGAAQSQAQNTSTSLQGLSQQNSEAGLPGQGQPGVANTPGEPTLNQPLVPNGGISQPYTPGAKASFVDIIFGRTPPEMQTNQILTNIAADSGETPENVQQRFNAIITGDYVFRPDAATTPPSYIPNVPFDKVQEESARLFSGRQFKSQADQARAYELAQQGFTERDPAKVKEAFGMTMPYQDQLAQRSAGRGGPKTYTPSQWNTTVNNAVGMALGGTSKTSFSFDPVTGEQSADITVDIGQDKNLGAIQGGAQMLTKQLLNTQKIDHTNNKQGDAELAAAKSVAYLAAERMSQMAGSEQSDEYKSLQAIYQRALTNYGITSKDLTQVAELRGKQVVFNPDEAPALAAMDAALSTSNEKALSALAAKHPDIYEKWTKDHENKEAPGGNTPAATKKKPLSKLEQEQANSREKISAVPKGIVKGVVSAAKGAKEYFDEQQAKTAPK